MNGPQRTACLAKGYANNNNNQLTDFLGFVIGLLWHLSGKSIPPNITEEDKALITILSVWRVRQDRQQTQFRILSLAGSQNLCQTKILNIRIYSKTSPPPFL